VPVVLGTTRDETRLFLFTNPAYVRRWFGIVPRVRDAQQYEIAAEYTSKMWKAAAADEPATRLRRVQGPNVWVYRFDWHEEPTILGTDLSVMLGAAHAFEVPFVFGHFDLGREANVIWTKANEPGRAALSAAMMSYWAEFAWTGDPSAGRHGELPRWGAWDDERPQFLVLDTPAAGGIRTSSEVLTKATVVAAIEADPRMPSRGEKCACYGTLTQWPGRFTRDDYAAACATFPLARRP
jgi:para-nitrobenzyl esterase